MNDTLKTHSPLPNSLSLCTHKGAEAGSCQFELISCLKLLFRLKFLRFFNLCQEKIFLIIKAWFFMFGACTETKNPDRLHSRTDLCRQCRISLSPFQWVKLNYKCWSSFKRRFTVADLYPSSQKTLVRTVENKVLRIITFFLWCIQDSLVIEIFLKDVEN